MATTKELVKEKLQKDPTAKCREISEYVAHKQNKEFTSMLSGGMIKIIKVELGLPVQPYKKRNSKKNKRVLIGKRVYQKYSMTNHGALVQAIHEWEDDFISRFDKTPESTGPEGDVIKLIERRAAEIQGRKYKENIYSGLFTKAKVECGYSKKWGKKDKKDLEGEAEAAKNRIKNLGRSSNIPLQRDRGTIRERPIAIDIRDNKYVGSKAETLLPKIQKLTKDKEEYLEAIRELDFDITKMKQAMMYELDKIGGDNLLKFVQ